MHLYFTMRLINDNSIWGSGAQVDGGSSPAPVEAFFFSPAERKEGRGIEGGRRGRGLERRIPSQILRGRRQVRIDPCSQLFA